MRVLMLARLVCENILPDGWDSSLCRIYPFDQRGASSRAAWIYKRCARALQRGMEANTRRAALRLCVLAGALGLAGAQTVRALSARRARAR